MTKPRDRVVRLGYELGSGEAVEIPIRHMVVAGQTQEAGKTTTLEALVARSGLRALSFVTKTGESAFAGGARIPPYFREQSDWRFVEALLEAHMGERMKFERNWISRACEGTKTLEEVRVRAKQLSESARSGMNQDQFRMLGVYLDELVPAIAAVPWASRVDLREGVNVMDVTLLSTELQQLVIKSALDWVLKRERDVVVVVPEAWQFVPEGRKTPAKMAAQAYIRLGAALRNYLWLDSQDIGGVDKETLRSCPVWVLGVQRERNEIKRTLENIPTPIRPKSHDIATLELGQFIACWGKHVRKVYVQPAWLSESDAARVAQGLLALDGLRRPRPKATSAPPARRVIPLEVVGDADLVEAVERFVEKGRRAENAVAQIAAHGPGLTFAQLAIGEAFHWPLPLPRGPTPMFKYSEREYGWPAREGGVGGRGTAEDFYRVERWVEEEEMPAEKVEELIKLSRENNRSLAALSASVQQLVAQLRGPTPRELALEPWPLADGPVPLANPAAVDVDAIAAGVYERVLERAAEDPRSTQVLELAFTQPELRVKMKRDVVSVDGESIVGRVARLMIDDFFLANKTGYATWQELTARGWRHDRRSVDKVVADLAARGFLRREGREGYIIVGGAMKRVVEEGS